MIAHKEHELGAIYNANPLISGNTYYKNTPNAFGIAATMLNLFWSGATGNYSADRALGVRPTVSFKADIKYTSGIVQKNLKFLYILRITMDNHHKIR